MTEWQAQGFDKNSYFEDPQLDSYFVAKSASCKSKGFASFVASPTSNSPVGSSGPSPSSPSKSATSSAAVLVVSVLHFAALFVL